MAKIFVFGSNLAGIHGAGAAKVAEKEHGAIRGIGVGRVGESYAIPSKDCQIVTLPLKKIEIFVEQFKTHAEKCPADTFQVTQIGCGLAGYDYKQIAPMFIGSPLNCEFDEAWRPVLGDEYTYWGTH